MAAPPRVTEDGRLFSLGENSNSEWFLHANAFLAKDIAVGEDGSIKIVDSNGRVHKKVAYDTGWEEEHKFFAASRIAITSTGITWAVDKFNGTVYQQANVETGWQAMGGVLARDIAVAPDGSVWVIALDGLSLHVYRGGAWQPEYYLNGTVAVSMAVDENGNPWFVSNINQIWAW